MDNSSARRNLIITIVLIALLISAVRAFYWTGPLFANSQDEGLYFNMLAGTVIHSNAFNFDQYRGANFSNVTYNLFNPAPGHQFYVGLLYPELFLLKTFGFNATLAIAYVAAFSVVEGIMIFLMLDLISTRRAAVVGGILLAFFPLDVLFSTHLQPLVPMIGLVSVSAYLFIRAYVKADKKAGIRRLLYLLSGIFFGFAFLTNPLALFWIAFLTVFFVYKIARSDDRLAELSFYGLILLGGILAYSIAGALFYAQAGNFFLYPEVYHALYNYQTQTQSYTTYRVIGSIYFKYTDASPLYYLPILLNLPLYQYLPELRYFSIMIYAFVAACIALFIKANKWLTFFLAMFVVGFLFIQIFPTGYYTQAGGIYIYITNMMPYLSTVLTIPVIVMVALFIEQLASHRRSAIRFIGYMVLVAIIATDIAVLNKDIAFYRAGLSTIYDLSSFVQAHPNATVFAVHYISDEVNVYTNYKYNVLQIWCNSSAAYNINDSYIAIGGTGAVDLAPELIQQFDSCIAQNLTGFSPIYTYQNKLAQYYGQGSAPNLTIYERNSSG